MVIMVLSSKSWKPYDADISMTKSDLAERHFDKANGFVELIKLKQH